MPLSVRDYREDDDYWRIRGFLRDSFLHYDRHERNWPLYRFDYWRWHVLANIVKIPLDRAITLWETEDSSLAAVLITNELGDGALQIHPAWESAELIQSMIETAESRVATETADGKRVLTLWADAKDEVRKELLCRRGYSLDDWPEFQRYRSLCGPIPDPVVPAGFVIRSLSEGVEMLERCYASGLAFHPDEIEIALDNRRDIGWYRNIQRAPLYRRDLDLVAVAETGEVAAFTTIWFDDVTRTGAFEPVGTVPAYQRRGLGKALLTEGIHRLSRLGATWAAVSSYSVQAGALYEAAGFADYDISEPWKRIW